MFPLVFCCSVKVALLVLGWSIVNFNWSCCFFNFYDSPAYFGSACSVLLHNYTLWNLRCSIWFFSCSTLVLSSYFCVSMLHPLLVLSCLWRWAMRVTFSPFLWGFVESTWDSSSWYMHSWIHKRFSFASFNIDQFRITKASNLIFISLHLWSH